MEQMLMLMEQEEVDQEQDSKIMNIVKETHGQHIKIQKEENNKYQMHGKIMKLKIIMQWLNQKDGEIVELKVIKKIQVHQHGENMEH